MQEDNLGKGMMFAIPMGAIIWILIWRLVT